MHDPHVLSAELCLTKLLLEVPVGWPSAPVRLQAHRQGTVAVLMIHPPGQAPMDTTTKRLSTRERQLIEVVHALCEQHNRRVQGCEIIEAAKRNGLEWAASTLQRSLAKLVRRGHLANDHDGRGYGPKE